MSEQTTAIISKVWGMCSPLRDDGVGYGDYLEQLTYLIFLKMSDEYSKPPYKKDTGIPAGYGWSDMSSLKGAELEEKYKKILEKLGEQSGILGKIFKGATNKISNAAILYRVVQMIDGEKWGIMKIVYMMPQDNKRGYVEMVIFKPFRPMQKLDMNYIRQCRSKFTLEEWVDVLISAMEYTPSAFKNMTQKLEFVTRLLPFAEPRLNLIELAPKGTGKSYVFGNLSKFVWLVSGGKVSRAKLVYDKSTKAPGIMRFYDLVAFDEISSITFSDNSEMQSFLKNYLEYGRATIDNYEFMSECGLILLGNILLSQENQPLDYRYFDSLPEVFRESALLDRFHGMIEGWLLPRINVDMALHDWTLNVEFFSELLHHLRTESVYSQIVDEVVIVPKGADMRHTKAVKRVATAYLKLLFPHVTSVDMLNLDDFNMYCLQPAIRRRDIVREQCSNIDAESSFSKPIPEYSIASH